MRGVFTATLFAGLLALVYASSNPSDIKLVTVCDALSDSMGCLPNMWKLDNKMQPLRLNCTEKGKHMAWATRAVNSPCYKIIAGSEDAPVTSYIPGQIVNIQIRVLCYGMIYRGILIYAVNGTEETKVGDWDLTGGVMGDYMKPWTSTNSSCVGSLMHSTSENKPYLNNLNFVAPAAGTGKITFRVLLKHGDANTGDFFWPMNTISLNEGTVSTPDSFFTLGAAGQNCHDACNAKASGYGCDTSLLDKTDQFKTQVAAGTACQLPFLSGCGKDAGTFDPVNQYCYYPSTSCESDNRSAITTNCFTKLDGVEQFCACSKTAYAASSSAVTGDTPSGTNMASSANKVQGVSALLVLAMFFVSPRTASIFLVFLGLTSGHNWLNTNSRSSAATTFRPFKPATTDMPHLQVGPNQEFTMEWMAAHGGFSYFIVVHQADAGNLTDLTTAMLDDYLANAPAASKLDAVSPNSKWQKFHRKDRNSTNLYINNGTTLVDWFSRIINPGDPLFTPRNPLLRGQVGGVGNPNDNNTYLLQYRNDQIKNDLRAAYKSDKYPWMESVAKFEHVNLSGNQPDLANFTIPGNHGTGRYYVQYYWYSYRDVTDVDFEAAPVANIYGVKPDGMRWKRVDHCNFPNPRAIYDFSEIVAGSLDFCFNQCATEGTCEGVNVVPLMAPSTAFKFPQPNGTTWFYPQYYGADILIPFNTSMLFNNTEVDRLMAMAAPDKYACFNVYAREFSTTEDTYVLSKDPADPIFYSTCYWPYRGNIFPGYANGSNTPSVDPSEWRFRDQCIECESQAASQIRSVPPTWDVTDTCINCDHEPAAMPAAPVVTLNPILNNASCEGFSGRWKSASHYSCPTNNSCIIQLIPAGRRRGAFMGGGDMRGSDVTKAECAELTRRNPNCSSTYITTDRVSPYIPSACYCYASAKCCGSCSPISASSVNNVYDAAPVADPTCANGVLDSASKYCCSSSCGAGNCKALAAMAVSATGGFCNTAANFPTRSCKTFGAPCVM